jgi:integrase
LPPAGAAPPRVTGTDGRDRSTEALKDPVRWIWVSFQAKEEFAVLAKKKMNKKGKRVPWNKGVEVGRRAPLSAAEVTRIRKLLVKRGDSGLKHLALFSTAVDTMLRSPDLLDLKVGDVRKRNGVMRDSIALSPRGKRCNAVQCIVSKTTMSVLAKLIRDTGKKPRDYLFTGRVGGGLQPLSAPVQSHC